MTDELIAVGGPLGAVGFSILLLAPGRAPRLAGLAATGAGVLLLAAALAPAGHELELAAASVGGALFAAAGAVGFLRWPWVVPVIALALTPVRIPVDIGTTEANLLLPLYAVVAAAALALGYQLLRDDGRARELGALAWPVAAFVLWSGISLLWSDAPREGAISMLAFYLPFGVLAVWISRLEWRRRWVAWLGAQLVGMALLFAAIGMYQWMTREVFWNPKVIIGNAYAPFYRVNSVFWDPSIYGRFLVIAILAALVLVLYGAARRTAWGAVAAVVVLWVGLLISFSQSSFVALIAGVLGAAALAWRGRAIVALGVVSVLVLAVGFATPPVREALVEDAEAGVDRVTGGRAKLVVTGAEIAVDHPIAGVGLGGFKRAYAEREGLRGEDPRGAASHNTPVTVAVETGLPGLVLFLWIVAAALVLAFRRASRSFAGRVSLVLGLALGAIAVHSLFYNAFFEDPFTWGLLGLIAVTYAWRTARAASANPSGTSTSG